MQIQSISIEHFRGISSLKVDDLKQINLLTGRNNCGKTSILEALFMLSGPSAPWAAVSIHNLRNLILYKDDDFSFMFQKLDFSVPIKIEGIIGTQNRTLKITPTYELRQMNEEIQNKPPDQSKSNTIPFRTDKIGTELQGINLDFSINGKQYQAKSHIGDGGKILGATPKDYQEEITCHFRTPRTTPGSENIQPINDLIVRKKIDKIISILQKIDAAIIDIRSLAENRIYVDIGAPNLLPINITGDGLNAILSLLASIADVKDGVLLIDEIENGLHYSTLRIMWRAIIEACKEYNVQIVATTHSYECVEALSKSYNEIAPEGDDIRLYRIDRKDDIHKAFSYTAEILKAGLEKEFEVR